MYSTDTRPNDWLVYDSLFFGTLVEAYGTSQNMNAWRLTAVGLPQEIRARNPIEANVELCANLGLTFDEASLPYDLNKSWVALAITKEEWLTRIGDLPASIHEIEEQQKRIRKLRPAASRSRRQS